LFKNETRFSLDYPPTSLADEPPYRHREAYQPLPLIPPKQGNMNIQKSPFMPQDSDEFPPPPEVSSRFLSPVLDEMINQHASMDDFRFRLNFNLSMQGDRNLSPQLERASR
jgi:hypothetical protein